METTVNSPLEQLFVERAMVHQAQNLFFVCDFLHRQFSKKKCKNSTSIYDKPTKTFSSLSHFHFWIFYAGCGSYWINSDMNFFPMNLFRVPFSSYKLLLYVATLHKDFQGSTTCYIKNWIVHLWTSSPLAACHALSPNQKAEQNI